MYLALVILILIVCFLLALVVLAQNPKGGGLSSQFGAGGAANLMGVKRTGDLLEKLTWGFAVSVIVLTLATHMLGGNSGPVRSINQQAAQKAVVPVAPAAPASAPTAPAPTSTMPAPAPQPATAK